MLLSYAWLKSYLSKLPSPDKLGEMMLLHGLDVEDVASTGAEFDHVVVGQIETVRPHPNADKLRLADVRISEKEEPQEIVCGAPNIEAGQKVAVALVGAKLPNGMTIEPRAIRGVTSNGMICAEDELGLGKNHAGVMMLDPKTKIGTPLAEVLGSHDMVFDVTTPANRADLMSMRGLAWEIGAMLGQRIQDARDKVQGKYKVPKSKPADGEGIQVSVEDQRLCPLYTLHIVRGIQIQPSPTWLQQRVRAAGMRSVNSIVDITNYVMLEYGQPLHAYDTKTVLGGILTTRLAKAGEQLVTLDGKTRILTPDMLVIADQKGPVGLAGVMGGQATEVTTSTTDIILEAAIFHPVSIRKTSRRLGLVSEASKRFEKGLWPEVTLAALNAAANMMADVCGGTVEAGIVSAGVTRSTPRTVSLAPSLIAQRLGMKITAAKSKTILQRLGFGVKGTATNWSVSIPVWRPDVSLPEDIIDEVGRMIGYDSLSEKMPSEKSDLKELPKTFRFKEEVKNILVDLGFTEVISHAFYGEHNAKLIKGSHFEIANPLDETQHKLRKSLFPQIEDVLKRQANAGADATVFEIGLVFDPERPGAVDRQQYWKVALGMTHKDQARLNAVQQAFQKKLGTHIQPYLMVADPVVRGRKIEYCVFDLAELLAATKTDFGLWDPNRHVVRNVQYRAVSKFPPIVRDISFWWSGTETALQDVLQGLHIPLLKDFTLKDQFSKDGQTSYAYTFVYQSPERTLTKAEVDVCEAKIKNALINLGARVR